MKEGIIEQPNYKFKIDRDKEISLFMLSDVFIPTGTSRVLLKAVQGRISKPGKLLDLGCSCGVVGIILYQMGLAKAPLYASDLSERAIDNLSKNALFHHCPVIAKCGSVFDPWKNEKFDYVVNDVSGVAMEVAKISPWFNNVPCQSGIDGTSLVVEVLQKAPAHLNFGGLFFFPVISFSNVSKILKVAHDNFSHVEHLVHQEWPLPKQMQQHISTLKELFKEGHIQIEERFGMVLWFTDIYVAYNS